MTSPVLDRTFRLLFVAQIAALGGTGLSTIAPVVGGLAHRLPRRPLLIGLDLGRAVSVAGLPFVTEVWQVYLLIFVMNACSAGFAPTFQATIPDGLPDEARYTLRFRCPGSPTIYRIG